jgi:prepilin-type processing-associated H-X9-DG protein
MNERTALFLASLSHQWSLQILLLTIVLGVATCYAGVLKARARTRDDTLAQRKWKQAQRITSTLLMLNTVVLGIAVAHLGCAAIQSHSAQCRSNLKQLARGVSLYAQDYDERLPLANPWAEAIDSRVKAYAGTVTRKEDDPFRCPSSESPAGYGMNAAMSGLSYADVEEPATSLLLFEADAPIRSFAGGAKDVAQARHNGAPNVSFADGHVKHANSYYLKTLNWTPKAVKSKP